MSRELDVEIARVIFGIKRVYGRGGIGWAGEHELYYIPSGKPWRTHSIDAIPVPRYSTDIAAAWLVVERMRCEWWVRIWEPSRDMWAVTFADHRADAVSLPEAICAAAIDAIAALHALEGTPAPECGPETATATQHTQGESGGALCGK